MFVVVGLSLMLFVSGCFYVFAFLVVWLCVLSLACMFGFVLVLVVGVVGKCLVLLVSVC